MSFHTDKKSGQTHAQTEGLKVLRAKWETQSLVEKLLRTPWDRWKGNIKMGLGEILCRLASTGWG